MAATVRRPAAAAAAPVEALVSFGNLDMYAAGGGLAEGDYVIAEMTNMMFQATNQAGATFGPARLGCMIHLQSMAEPAAEFKTQFYSMGGSAHESFQPSANGKGLVAVPGGKATVLNDATNWMAFLKSLYNAGLPAGIFDNDLSVLEGTHVHLAPVPPPKERAGFQSKTAEVAVEQAKPRDIMVVTEIKEDGKPWENTGGLLEATAAPAAAAKPGAAKPAAARAAVAAAAPVAAAAAAATDGAVSAEDLQEAASNGITAYLEANPNGGTKLALRMATHKNVSASLGPDVAKLVVDTFFKGDAELNSIINVLGFKVVGAEVKVA